jgi:hypothetical protein
MTEAKPWTSGNGSVDGARSGTRRDLIAIDGPVVSDRHRVTFRLHPQGRIRRFFIQNSFWAEYDVKIQDVSHSILAIPCLSAVI